MKKYNRIKFWAFAVVIFSLVLISSSVLVSQGNMLPMEFTRDIYFEKELKVRIEKENNLFLNMIKMLIKTPADQIDEFIEVTKEKFKDTYLYNPTLTTEEHKFEGWDNVIPVLKEICTNGKRFRLHKVNVNLKYKAYDKVNRPKPEQDPDFEILIKTEFSSPSIEGRLRHRRPSRIDP